MRFRCFCLIWIWSCSSYGEQTILVNNPHFKTGSEAFTSGKYATAAANFQAAWAQLGNEADSLNRSVVASRLIESWYRNHNQQTAVRWYRGIETQNLTDDAKKWVALSMLDAGYYKESAQIFDELSRDVPRPLRREMSVYRAHALVRDGAAERAYRLIFPDFAPPENPVEAYFFAGIAHETNRWEEGISLCETAAEIEGASAEFYTKVAILKARCLAGAGRSLEAVTLMLELIEKTLNINVIYGAFDILMQIATSEEREILASRFENWANDPLSPNRGLAARYYSILIDSDPDEENLVRKLESFITEHPDHSLAHEARLMLGSIRPDLAMKLDLPENSSDSEELRRHIDFGSAVRQFQQESFRTAKETFLEMSNQLEGRQRDQALFNSAIASLYEGDDNTFEEMEKAFAKDGSVASAMHADLLFLGGLYYASKANPAAFDLLTKFTKSYPEHTSVVDAKLAIAELHLNQVPAQAHAAREVFKDLKKLELSQKRKERLSYTEVWAELLTDGANRTIEKATAFLVDWPNSKLRPEVSMLLATEFYEKRRFEAAEKAFLRIVRDFPDTIHRETALFFAAKARDSKGWSDAGRVDNWEDVIKNGGTLANHARHQKGLNLLEKNRFDESIRVFDEILDAEKLVEPDLRISTRCDKGYALFLKALAFGSDKATLSLASDEFAKVLSDKLATRAWRYQASVRRGKCLELLGRENVALEIYQSLAWESGKEQSPQIGSSPSEENKWLYRAGFIAIEILEKKKDWNGAVKIADILSQRNGVRASEARERADHLRLRHFVWD